MRSALPDLAEHIGADERTLRRAVRRGLVHSRRPGPRRLLVDPLEREYLRIHWGLLDELSAALRTEPNVRLAVVYGSIARGDDHEGSDLDLLVGLRDDRLGASGRLAGRLEHALSRDFDVDVARLSRVRDSSPLLVLQALDEGRVVVDRDYAWPQLLAERPQLARAARRKRQADIKAAAASYAELVS